MSFCYFVVDYFKPYFNHFVCKEKTDDCFMAVGYLQLNNVFLS